MTDTEKKCNWEDYILGLECALALAKDCRKLQDVVPKIEREIFIIKRTKSNEG